MIKTVAEALPELQQLLRAKRLVLFAGSGISVDPPASLPTWDGLLDKFIDWCGVLQPALPTDMRFEKLLLEARDHTQRRPVQVASALKDQLLEVERRQSRNLQNAFANWLIQTLTGKPNAYHHAIAKTDYPLILTSNYDGLIEAAALENNLWQLHMTTYSYKDPDKVAAAMYVDEPAVVHIHGQLPDVALGDIVFTQKDYTRIRRDHPGFTTILHTVFIKYSSLFVGYGGSDPHLEQLLEDSAHYLKNSTAPNLPQAYLVLRSDKVNAVLERYKMAFRTNIITVDKYEDALGLLESLQAGCPRTNSGGGGAR